MRTLSTVTCGREGGGLGDHMHALRRRRGRRIGSMPCLWVAGTRPRGQCAITAVPVTGGGCLHAQPGELPHPTECAQSPALWRPRNTTGKPSGPSRFRSSRR